MLPAFPTFKRLELSDSADIQHFARQFPPYSDFNFTSLWCWDTKGEVSICELDGNLVVRFTDYLTGKPFYSFLGDRMVEETAHELLGQMRAEQLGMQLKLVPEIAIGTAIPRKVLVDEDRENFDYMLSTTKLATYRGNKFGPKRNFVNRFRRLYNSRTEILDLQSAAVQVEVSRLFWLWVGRKELAPAESKNEFTALLRLFNLPDLQRLIPVGVFISDVLVGFTVCELVQSPYSILHFEKADSSYVGIYPYLMQETAKVLLTRGCTLLNYEQDLGLAGLRKAKLQYHPEYFLKKVILLPLEVRAVSETSPLPGDGASGGFAARSVGSARPK